MATILDKDGWEFEVEADVSVSGRGDEIEVDICDLVLTSDKETIKVESIACMPDRFEQIKVNELEAELISNAEQEAESRAVESAMHYYEER